MSKRFPTQTELKRIYGETTSGRLEQLRYIPQVIAKYKLSPSLLDIGCAEGYFLEFFPALEKVGLEIDPYAIKNKINTFPVYHRWEDCPQVDCITLIDVAEHLAPEGLFEMVQKCHDHLNREGIIFLQTDNPLSLVAHLTHYNDLTHEKMYAPHLLQAVLKYYGFEILEIGFVGSHQFNHCRLMSMVAWIYRKLKYGITTIVQDRYYLVAKKKAEE